MAAESWKYPWRGGRGRPKPGDLLIRKLRSLGYPLGDDARLRRLYPSPNQRSQGHWGWAIEWTGHSFGEKPEIGSVYPVSMCLKAHHFEDFPDNEIFPVFEGE